MYKSIPGYPNYIINEEGEVMSMKFNKIKILKPSNNGNGYLVICLSKNGKQKTGLVHRLLYETFVGEIPPGFEIDHIDCNPSNNTLSNLRAVTQQQNTWNRKKAKGCTFNKRDRKWQASIYFNGKRKNLGNFENEEDARSAYLKAKEIFHIIPVRS